jgi:uncharacterized membrane protein
MAKLAGNGALRYRPGLLLGVGLGALLDGIVFHQVLRWHHFVSDERRTDTVAGLDANTLADGLFHVVAWIVLVSGLILFYRSARAQTVPWGRAFAGSVVVGVGSFNLVDALVSHWILGLHHIHQGSYELLSDVVYFVVSAGLVIGGAALGASQPSAARGTVPAG